MLLGIFNTDGDGRVVLMRSVTYYIVQGVFVSLKGFVHQIGEYPSARCLTSHWNCI